MTVSRVIPAASALRASRPSVGAELRRAPFQVKFAMCNPSSKRALL